MRVNSLNRIVLITICTVVFIAVLIVNALAGAGKGELSNLVLTQCFVLRFVTAKVKLPKTSDTRLL